jgi:hypothetical protein
VQVIALDAVNPAQQRVEVVPWINAVLPIRAGPSMAASPGARGSLAVVP